jgi:DNA-binding NarL/FixJ family response regulator
MADRFTPLKSLRVVIADDHPSYREGLARSLRESGIRVVDAGPSGEAAARVVEETAPDVVILDLTLPDMSGLEVTERLMETAPASRVLMLSVSAGDPDVSDAILAGASGFLPKDSPVEEIIAWIYAAAAGHPPISAQVAAALLRRVGESQGDDEEPLGLLLSSRELEVLGLLADGKPIHEIATALRVAPDAVQNYISSILAKVRVPGRSGSSSAPTQR